MSEQQEKKPLDPHSPEGMIAHLHKWEREYLAKNDPKKMNVEFGMVSGALRKIGENCNRRLNSKFGTRCSECGAPIDGMRMAGTVPTYDDKGNTLNWLACSSKCYDLLRDKAHVIAVNQQTGAN